MVEIANTGGERFDVTREPREARDERYRLLVETVQDYAILMLDPDGYVETWNNGAARISGYTASEIIGRHFSTFYPKDDVGKCANELEVARTVGRFEEEGWRIRKDGSRYSASVVLTALRSPEGELLGFAKVTRDLTERRRAEDSLRASEERFRLLVESVSDYAIFMLDPRGIVQTWNEGARRIKGYAASEIIGRSFETFYPPEEVRAGKCARELEIAARDGRYEEEGWRIRKDGARLWANVVITALRDRSGTLVGYAKVTRDLTDRRRTEQERLRLAQAEEANRIKDEILASVSHELRTPLNAILGWTTLLAEGTQDPALKKPLQTIRRNAEAQARIIEDVLDVSRIVTGKLRLELAPVDLAVLVRDAMDAVRTAADVKDIALALEHDGRPAVTVGDATRLQQVVWNLLSNAVKFSSISSKVVIRLVRTPDAVQLVVRDHGVGIDPAFLPHAFDRFRQADSSSSRQHGGLGLGLAIVRHIIELHGGGVKAESEGLGKGATFTFTLPLRAESQPTPGPSAEARATELEGVSVLLVDDDEDTRELIARVLGDAGAMVHDVSSASAARAALESRIQPDILVSDIAMPGEDGYDLVEWLRKNRRARDLPALALTAYASPSDRTRALSAGFDAHLAKPAEPHELVRIVRGMLRS